MWINYLQSDAVIGRRRWGGRKNGLTFSTAVLASIRDFNEWQELLPLKGKVPIPGNHHSGFASVWRAYSLAAEECPPRRDAAV